MGVRGGEEQLFPKCSPGSGIFSDVLYICELKVYVYCISCELDPIPTWLLKQCSHELVPLITATTNASLTTSNVPADFMHAIVKPLLKKPTLGKDILQNYRPVLNLPFVSKLVEKVVAKQISKHVDENDDST